jgi:hypothetical protein
MRIQQRSFFLCSRMRPRGLEGIRDTLRKHFGGLPNLSSSISLYVEEIENPKDNDVRAPCARAILDSDGVVVLLDGGESSALTRDVSTVLELELMLAAVHAKAMWVIDLSDGEDPIFKLFGSEFFTEAKGESPRLIRLAPDKSVGLEQRVIDIVGEICGRAPTDGAKLSEGLGWEMLFKSRGEATLDLGSSHYFPFGQRSLGIPDVELSEIRNMLDKAETAYKTDQILSLVHSWDAIRALSGRPWAASALDETAALEWMRAWKYWGGSMSWLGLFGHSSAAATLVSRSALIVSRRFDSGEMKAGAPFGPDRHLGSLASNHFSLSKVALSAEVRDRARTLGIDYCTEGLRITNTGDYRSQAGLLAVRGVMRLSAGFSGALGFKDLMQCEALHLKAANGISGDVGFATAQVQSGAAFKELARRIPMNGWALKLADRRLSHALEVLEFELTREPIANSGQVLMCMKHLIETWVMMHRDNEAHDLWIRAIRFAKDMGFADQKRQLEAIGRNQMWLSEANY